jgi:hypothetical protein
MRLEYRFIKTGVILCLSVVAGCQTGTLGYLDGATPEWVTETFVDSMMHRHYGTASMCVRPSARQIFKESISRSKEFYDALFSLDVAVAENCSQGDIQKFRDEYLWCLLGTPLKEAIDENRIDWDRVQWKRDGDICDVWVQGVSRRSFYLKRESGNWYINPYYRGTPMSTEPLSTWAMLCDMSKCIRRLEASVRSGDLSATEMFEELDK